MLSIIHLPRAICIVIFLLFYSNYLQSQCTDVIFSATRKYAEPIIVGCTEFTYTIKLENTGSTDVTLDIYLREATQSSGIATDFNEMLTSSAPFVETNPNDSFFEYLYDDFVLPASSIHTFTITTMLLPTDNVPYPCVNNYSSELPFLIQVFDQAAIQCDSAYFTIVPSVGCLLDGSSSPFLASTINADSGFVNALLDRQFTVKGEFVIDENFDYFNNNAGGIPNFIAVLEGGKISVKDGVELELRETFVQGCEHMWQGIDVEGSIRFEELSISDAEFAVQARDGAIVRMFDVDFIDNYVGFYVPPAGSGSNTIDITLFADLTFTTSGDGLLAPYSGQTNIPEDQGRAGVLIYDTPGINLSGVSTTSTGFYVHYDKLANGIEAYNSNLTVTNSLFTEITSEGNEGYDHQGNGIYLEGTAISAAPTLFHTGFGKDLDDNTVFDGVDFGITLKNANAFITKTKINTNVYDRSNPDYEELGIGLRSIGSRYKLFVLSDSRIQASYLGISTSLNAQSGGIIQGSQIIMHNEKENFDVTAIRSNEVYPGNTLWVNDNEIILQDAEVGLLLRGLDAGTYINDNTIRMGVLSTVSRYKGAVVENCFGVVIECNDFIGNASSLTENWKKTTLLTLSASSNTLVKCNNFESSEHAIQIYDMCTGTELLNNTFNEHYQAVLYGRYNGNDEDGLAFSGPQEHGNNAWPDMYQGLTLSTDRYGAIHLSDNENVILQSKFTYDTDGGSNPDFLPIHATPNSPGANWFSSSEDPDGPSSCPSGSFCDPSELEGIFDELDLNISRGALSIDTFEQGLIWTAEKQLLSRYDYLVDTPDTTAVDTFYSNKAQYSAGLYSDWWSGLYSNLALSSSQDSMLSTLQDSVVNNLLQLQLLDSLLFNNPTYGDSLQYLADKQTALDSLGAWSADLEGILASKNTSIASSISTMTAQNSALPDTAFYEEKARLINTYLLYGLANDDVELPGAYRSSLDSVAQLCPFEYGAAVFQARAWLDDGAYDLGNNCFAVGSRVLQEAPARTQEKSFSLSPNPVSNTLQISGPVDPTQGIRVNIFDLAGKLVYAGNYRGLVDAPILIDLFDLEPGMYLLMIAPEQGVIETHKFVKY